MNSNTDEVKVIDGMIQNIKTGLNEGDEGFNEADMNVNGILKVLSDRSICGERKVGN